MTDIRNITEKVARRVHRWLEKRVQKMGEEDALRQEQPLLANCYASSLRYLTAFGNNAGRPLMRVHESIPEQYDAREERSVLGFNLHASIGIAADDCAGLLRLLRYMGRPPLSEERLSKTKDGKLILRLKTPWKDGTSKLILSPLELIERLVALLPPPRKHMIRYAGVFAPNSHLRRHRGLC